MWFTIGSDYVLRRHLGWSHFETPLCWQQLDPSLRRVRLSGESSRMFPSHSVRVALVRIEAQSLRSQRRRSIGESIRMFDRRDRRTRGLLMLVPIEGRRAQTLVG